jgi:hypothetical protein
MSLRETLGLPIVLRDVVAPCLAQLVRAGELDGIRLEWRTVQVPSSPDDTLRALGPGIHIVSGPPKMIDELRLRLTLTFGEESFGFDIAAEEYFPSAVQGDLSWVRDELFSSLQDFIAESRFGWGQLRE